jgi:hypothetical protein
MSIITSYIGQVSDYQLPSVQTCEITNGSEGHSTDGGSYITGVFHRKIAQF